MELYTVQLAKWRSAKKLDISVIDITVKSGDKAFSPTWNLLARFKAGAITEQQYRTEFIELMRLSYSKNENKWLDLANGKTIAIACYCPAGSFCHRHILVELFSMVCEKHAITFKYSGEIE